MTATHAIWLVAIVTAAGIGADHLLEVEPELREAREHAELRGVQVIGERAPGATNCYDSVDDKIVFRARNRGDSVIDAHNVTFLVDGVFVDGWVAEIEGARTGDWRPGDNAFFNVSGILAEPQRVTAQTLDGTTIYSEHVTCPRLALIVIAPTSASMQIGDTQDFAATGYDQFGDFFDGRPYSWSSAAGAVTTLTSSTARLVAGTVAGSFTMVATSGTVNGNVPVVIHPGVPASVAVSPAAVDVAAGGTQAFTATVYDAYGNVNSTASVSWSTNAGSITSGGVLTAQTTPQSARIVTATSGGVSGNADVNIVPGAVHHIDISPTSATLLTSASQSFSATAYDQYNNAITGTTFTWAASRGSISQAGLFTAPTTVGATTVYANASGVSGSAGVTVTANVNVLSLETYKNGVQSSSFLRGDTVEVRVVIRDQAGNLVPDATVTVQYTYPPTNTVDFTGSDATDTNGMASISHTLPGNAKRDTWTITVTDVVGTNLTYTSGSNAQTSTTFVVN